MIQYNIKKELFEAVMYITLPHSQFKILGDVIIYGEDAHISIADFFFKCNVWAFSLVPKYVLSSSIRSCSIYIQSTGTNFQFIKTFDNLSQKQALFDACHYLLKLRKQNDTNISK